MNSMFIILDACSIINLIHIDEDDFILKKLKNLEISISDCVFKEVKKNVYKNIKTSNPSTEYKNRSSIDQNLTFFRNFRVLDETLDKEMGEDFFDHVGELANYAKRNGEFYSAALALYMSREKPTKVFFHTDDFPAKSDFSHFFNFQQIGHIEDTADLLMLLHRLDDGFSKKDLQSFLSKLFSEYASDVATLLKKLREYQIPKILLKDRRFNQVLHQIITDLSTYNFSNLKSHFSYFFSNPKKYKSICGILINYNNVMDLQSNTGNLLEKIKTLQKSLEKQAVFKV